MGDSMYSYIIGKIVEVNSNYVVLDNNGIGYLIYTPNPYAFKENDEYKIYLYQQIKEDEHLKKFPKIWDKLARQMILDLKGKIVANGGLEEVSTTDEVFDALIALGYKDKDIKGVIARVNKELSVEEQIKEALRLMIK